MVCHRAKRGEILDFVTLAHFCREAGYQGPWISCYTLAVGKIQVTSSQGGYLNHYSHRHLITFWLRELVVNTQRYM